MCLPRPLLVLVAGLWLGSCTVHAQFTWAGGTASLESVLGSNTIAAGVTLGITTTANHDFNGIAILNHGTVNWTSGYIRAGNGATFTNAAGATFNDLNASSYTVHNPGFGGTFVFINEGDYVRSVGGTTAFDTTFDNSGTVTLSQGNLQFRAGGTMSGTGSISAATGTNVYFTNNYTIENGASLTGEGAYWLTGGNLQVPGTITVGTLTQTGGTLAGTNVLNGIINWYGGSWNANSAGPTTTIAAGAILNLGSGANHDFNYRGIVNEGTANWTSGYIRAGNGATFTNAAGATFNDLNASSYTVHNPGFGGTFVFINEGDYIRSVGGTTAFDTSFNNRGTIRSEAGTISFTNTFTNTDGTLTAAGGNFSFSNPLEVGTGSIGGSGTFTAPAVTTGGTVAPGNPIGLMSIGGNLTLEVTSTLLIELGGTASGTNYDFVSVSGNAILMDGFLDVRFVNSFEQLVTSADSFTILTGSSVSGTFTNTTSLEDTIRIATADGLGSFRINYNSNSVVLTDFQAIPEPSTYALIGLGAVVLAFNLRRRKS